MELKGIKKQYAHLKPQIESKILSIMESGNFIGGAEVDAFEETLASYVGVKHCISCSNGTSALFMILKALNIGEDDAVIVPDYTFFASAEVISAVGAYPIFADVSNKNFNIETTHLEELIENVKSKTHYNIKAVMAVDLFGLQAQYEELNKICEKYNLYLIEDAAQSIGGSSPIGMNGSFGAAAATSFFPSKPLGCYGDGGAIFTNNDEIASYIKSFKCHGMGKNKYDNKIIGINSRLDNIQAGILNVKINEFINSELSLLQEKAKIYYKLLNGVVDFQEIPKSHFSPYAQFAIKFHNEVERARVIDAFKKANIPCAVYYPKPLHKLDVYKNINLYSSLKNSNQLSKTLLAIPFHSYLEEKEINYICNIIKSALNK